MNFVSLFAQSSEYYYYQDMDTANDAAYVGAGLFMILFALIAAAVAYVATALLLGRIFKKAGVESWKAWVPVYNSWVLLELGEQKGYWAVLALVPIVNIVAMVFTYIAMYRIGLSFGKDGAFVLLAIFLPLVWYIWLAFDNSTWKGPHQATTSQPVYIKEEAAAPPADTPKD